jgi:hypothetical protein
MRILLVLILLANAWAYGVGHGWFGRTPGDAGRAPQGSVAELNADKVALRVK